MSLRLSSGDRVKLSIRAERELLRFKDDHALWHKHIHNVELDPMQILKCMEMDAHPNTVDFSARRTRKTSIKELYCLKKLATQPYQEEGIVAPRLQQSLTNLAYHGEAIRRSEILRAYVNWKSGREQLTDSGYEFVNRSKAQAYGIMSQIDGDALSIASLEETDDMPQERLLSRFLPMLGGSGRMGAPRDASFKPSVRISGVFKGADTLQRLINSGEYHILPVVNVYMGIELGILNRDFVLSLRGQLPAAEWIRQYLCKNVAAANHIHERAVRQALTIGLKAHLAIAEPMPGDRYKKRGIIAFGYDHTGHGESPTASKSALVVTEQIGNFTTFPFVHTWPAGTDDKLIEMDLYAFWDYFRPEYAIGDAYGVGMLTSLNDRLYAAGLTSVDRRSIADGQSTGSAWQDWAFQPLRFEGMVKHSMASALRSIFHNGRAAIPYFDADMEDILGQVGRNVIQLSSAQNGGKAGPDWTAFIRQLVNIKATPTKASYASYKMVDPKIGDDLFDAAMAAVWAQVTRGVIDTPTAISVRTQTREQLLGQAPRLPAQAAA
ncbi:MAG: hypothetical protein Q8M53_11010 [Burkholderiales bacterium]|nr:hypothetical protein [Burkholderiales bacterium]